MHKKMMKRRQSCAIEIDETCKYAQYVCMQSVNGMDERDLTLLFNVAESNSISFDSVKCNIQCTQRISEELSNLEWICNFE